MAEHSMQQVFVWNGSDHNVRVGDGGALLRHGQSAWVPFSEGVATLVETGKLHILESRDSVVEEAAPKKKKKSTVEETTEHVVEVESVELVATSDAPASETEDSIVPEESA